MLRFYIAWEGKENEQIYDDKFKRIIWTNKIADPGRNDKGKIKFIEDVNTNLKDGTWKPVGHEILDKLGEAILIAGVPNKYGNIYSEEELKKLELENPDNWSYVDGVLYKARR